MFLETLFDLFMNSIRFFLLPASVLALLGYLYAFFSDEKKILQKIMYVSLKMTGLLNLFPVTLMIALMLFFETKSIYFIISSIILFAFLNNVLFLLLRKRGRVKKLRVPQVLIGFVNFVIAVILLYAFFINRDKQVAFVYLPVITLNIVSGILLLCELNNSYAD